MEVLQMPNVTKFLRSLPGFLEARVKRTILRLREYGNLIRFPHSKPIGNGLFELRVVGATHVRIIYFFHGNKVILVHGFIKKRQKLAQRDIEFALDMRQKYLA